MCGRSRAEALVLTSLTSGGILGFESITVLLLCFRFLNLTINWRFFIIVACFADCVIVRG